MNHRRIATALLLGALPLSMTGLAQAGGGGEDAIEEIR